jgi:hypothetical protein
MLYRPTFKLMQQVVYMAAQFFDVVSGFRDHGAAPPVPNFFPDAIHNVSHENVP